MDPGLPDGESHRLRPRLPRPRGDGPADYQRARAWAEATASPPTRGWTLESPHGPSQHGARGGFPAHAGMDLRIHHPNPRRTRLPRPRGDGPRAGSFTRLDLAASPPTRGWTLSGDRSPVDEAGFPAHAGMDPHPDGRSRGVRRLPRPRGDGPRARAAAAEVPRASPPTRGWTLLVGPETRVRRGFPAHAGMDPGRWRCAPSPMRLPRPRGDGPRYVQDVMEREVASPPTRGWTLAPFGQQLALEGFPAHAGMDLAPLSARNHPHRLPRPRGDGPSTPCGGCRERGASPPTRGWTRVGVRLHDGHSGFPAHAGMDP